MLEPKGLIKFGNRAEESIQYNCGEFMQSLIAFGVRLLETLFVVGLAGSVLVLVIAAFEDAEILLGRSAGDDEH